MHEITVRDMARFLEGKVDDPQEARRILEALDSNPELAAAAEFLCRDVEDDVAEDSSRIPLPDLSQTRLGRLTFVPDWTTWADRASVQTHMEVVVQNAVQIIPVSLTRQGEAITVQGGGVIGLEPISLVLGRFDFAKGRTKPLVQSNFVFPDDRPMANRDERRGNLTGKTPIVGRAYAAPPIGRADAAPGQRGDLGEVSHDSDFSARCAGFGLAVTASIPENQDGDVVMAELTGLPNGAIVRQPLEFECRGSDRRPIRKFKFAWPEIAPTPCTLTIRPLQITDLPLLSTDQVSTVLARQFNHVTAIPLLPNSDGRLRGLIRYSFQVEAASDPATCWLVRLAEVGGAA